VRRNLVIVRAGEFSVHEKWLDSPIPRNWDLIVGYTGDDPDRFRRPDLLRVDAEGPKWPALHRLIQGMAETIFRYDYVWLPDDDIDTDTATINLLFDYCAGYHLSLAQPALSPDSHPADPIARVDPRSTLRYTTFAGVAAPCFSGEFLLRTLPEFASAATGRALSHVWPTMLGADDIAIIDALTVRHIPHPNAESSSAAHHGSADEECEEYLAQQGIARRPAIVHRSVPTGFPEPPGLSARRRASTVPAAGKTPDPSSCVILVPVATSIEPGCARGLFELERRGYPVWRIYGASAIDQVRSQMATDALAAGFEELMWIDSDMEFDADTVAQLRAHDLPVVCAIYAKKGLQELVVHFEPGTRELVFGRAGGLMEIKYAATGFLLTKRCVYEKIQITEQLPTCNEQFGRATVPYFLPMISEDGGGYWYLGEDFAFSERARRSGFQIMADTRIRLGHIGRDSFSWEEAGSDRPQYDTYTYRLH
jgi:hypothetical protein